jgi:hypothetical protein
VSRRILRYFLIVCLIGSVGFAIWAWLRPYEWHPDPAARCRIVETMVTRDQSYHWIHVHLKVNPGAFHDLQKPVRLEDSSGKFHEPADTTFAGSDPANTTEIWFKFWLESADLTGPLVLHLNDGKLVVKAGSETPDPDASSFRNYTTNQW